MLSPMVLDILCGRHCCRCEHIEPEGNIMRLDRFCLTGQTIWHKWLSEAFYAQIWAGVLGLDPKKLFGQWVN